MTTIKLDKKYEGMCVALVDRKVVLYDKDISKLTSAALKKYPADKLTITSVPKSDKILIL